MDDPLGWIVGFGVRSRPNGSPSLTDTVAGQVHALFANILSGLPYAKAGRLRALAVTSSKRSKVLPELPTVAEQGLPGFDAASWFGIMVPAGMPAPVAEKLAQSLSASAQSADFKRLVAAQGMDAIYMGPAEAM